MNDQLSLKARCLKGLRKLREKDNFWAVVNGWKEEHLLPEGEMFKVLVYGPHKTFKTKIADRLMLMWPNCVVIEHPQERQDDPDERYLLGYPLVIQTHRRVSVINNYSINYEAVTVNKSRYFDMTVKSIQYLQLFPVIEPCE